MCAEWLWADPTIWCLRLRMWGPGLDRVRKRRKRTLGRLQVSRLWRAAGTEPRSQCLHSCPISACQPLDKYLSAN